MKKYFNLHLFSFLFFTAIIVCSTNSYAENDIKFRSLLKELGISHVSHLNEEPISDIPQGKVIICWVIDPAKLDVFNKLEEVELTKIEGNNWELKNASTGNNVAFKIEYNEGKIEVIKIASHISPDQTVSSPNDQFDLHGRFSLGARVSYLNYSDDDYTVFGIKVDTEPDDAVMFDVNFSYFFTNYFSAELSAGYVETDVDLTGAGSSGMAGELQQIPILLTGRFNIPIHNKIVPYLGGGVGYFINDFNQNDSVIELIYGAGAEVDVDNSWGYLINGGVDFLFMTNLALNFDVKYIWNKIEADVDRLGFEKEEFDANMLVIGGGMKYYF